MKLHSSLIFVLCFLVSSSVSAQVNSETPGWFPFTIPPLDDSETFLSLAELNPEGLSEKDRIAVKESHFFNAQGERVRFFGTNMTFQGAFPEKKDAPALAAHLAKFGWNIIRFHHIDGRTAPSGVWLKGEKALDPAQLDKLDWFIFQLKKNGVYTNLNLHVSRTYPEMKGVDLPRGFRYGKGLDNFYPPFIEHQKTYARLLLAHRNPYTGMTYAKDPAIAAVELNNENSMTHTSWSDWHKMPDPFRAEMARQWRGWLTNRYSLTEGVRKAWSKSAKPLGAELLKNGTFADGMSGWSIESHEGALFEGKAASDGQYMRLTGSKQGDVTWAMQFKQSGLALVNAESYTLRFRIRSAAERMIRIGVQLDGSPWGMAGLNEQIDVSPEWRTYTFTFPCRNPDARPCRVTFNMDNQLCQVDLANVSLRPGGLEGLLAGQTLEGKTITLPPRNACDDQRRDFWQFLADTETQYVITMRNYLLKNLRVKSLVSFSQANYGGRFGVAREGRLSDFVDMHSYWHHPSFPVRPWDREEWFVTNSPMIASPTGANLAERAWYRQVGKPFTFSEFDEPAPGDYNSEMYPVFAAIGAFQDWDAIYSFSYLNGKMEPENLSIRSFFDQMTHPGKKAFVPVAAVLFRTGAVQPGRQLLTAEFPTGDLAGQAVETGRDIEGLSQISATSWQHRVGMRLTPGKGDFAPPPEAASNGGRIESDTGEIVWDAAKEEAAVLTVDVPRVKMAIGFLAGRTIMLGGVEIAVTKSLGNWATVAVCALDGVAISESKRVLIVVAGRVENSNMQWNEKRNSVGSKWGDSPTVAEAVEATIRIPGAGTIHALDGTGAPQGVDISAKRAGGLSLKTDAKHRTLWYGLRR